MGNNSEVRKDNYYNIVTMDYRITVSIPIKYSVLSKSFPNEIYQLEEYIKTSGSIGVKDKELILALISRAIRYNVVSVEQFYELDGLYGRRTLICTFVFLENSDMTLFSKGLAKFEVSKTGVNTEVS